MNETKRKPETLISGVQAVGANVILAGEFDESLINIENGKLDKNVMTLYTVVSVGPEVREDIKLGQTVVIHSRPELLIEVASNNRSYYVTKNRIVNLDKSDRMDLSKIIQRIRICEYAVVHETVIVAVVEKALPVIPNLEDGVKFLEAASAKKSSVSLELPLD
jgi:hypothetical protein